MKKMVVICISPIILLMLIICSTLILPTQLQYQLKTVKGDAGYLKNVEIQSSITSGASFNDPYFAHSLIHINIKDGSVKHTVDYYTADEDQQPLTFIETGSIETTFMDNSNFDAEECQNKKEKVEDQVSVVFSTQELLQKTTDDVFSINTDMMFMNTANYQLYKETSCCEVEYSYENGEEIAKKRVKEHYVIEGKQPDLYVNTSNPIHKYGDSEYYFMPTTYEYMTGQNAIYRITVSKDTEGYLKYRGTGNEVVKLPKDRQYDRMLIKDHMFYVFAHTAEKNIVMKYDLEGSLVSEIILSEFQSSPVFATYTNDQYLLVQVDGSVFVIDLETMSIIDEYVYRSREEDQYYIVDMIYQNQMLYLLEDSGSHESIKDEDGGIYNSIRIANKIIAVSKKEVVFEGEIELYDGTGPSAQNYHVYRYDDKFRRDGS